MQKYLLLLLICWESKSNGFGQRWNKHVLINYVMRCVQLRYWPYLILRQPPRLLLKQMQVMLLLELFCSKIKAKDCSLSPIFLAN